MNERCVATWIIRSCAGGGAAVMLLGGLLAWMLHVQMMESYLLGCLFWINLALGCLALRMLHCLVGGRWGAAVAPFLRSAVGTMPLLGLLFLPILLNVPALYHWASEPEATHGIRAGYLNTTFFRVRAVAYFVIWIGAGYVLRRGGDDASGHRGARLLSGPGLGLYAITCTLAAIDWSMSLDDGWLSPVYGVHFMIGQGLSAFAFALVCRVSLPGCAGTERSPQAVSDVGGLLLTFVLLWAYITFSQYLIVWSGNLPEEAGWYLKRTGPSWRWIIWGLVVLHFALPFLLLLSGRVRERPVLLGALAGIILAMRFVDLFWLVAPGFGRSGVGFHWLDGVLPVGMGGLWMAMFLNNLQREARTP